MRTLIFIYFCLILFSCKKQSKISISNTLEIALGNKYSQYVSILNKAVDKDTAALLDFFKINYIYDAAGYDHGYILFQLIKKTGDKKTTSVLHKMNLQDLDNLRQYFEVGIDGSDKAVDEFIINFPLSRKILLKNR